MRVKKLNTNRRVRAGDDDGTSSSATGSPQQIHSPSQWASPTKTSIASYSPESDDGSASNANDPDDSNEFRRGDVIEIGADSPTDPTATPSVQSHEVTELDLDRHYLTTATNTSDMATTSVPTTKTNGPTNVGALVPTENETAATWRDSVDPAVRKGVHEKIVEYLGTLKPNAPPKVLEKLPGLAYRMEENLFKMATSETEYKDQTTLPQRLTLIQQANAKRLLQQQCPPVSPKGKEASASPTRSRKPLNEEQARVVFSCLQSWRQKLVNMYGSTPWEILPNKILAKVAVFIPSTTQELVVCGVAAEPLERFGNSLLQEIEKVMNALNANANAVMAMSQAASRGSSPSAGTKRPAASSKSSTNGQSAAKARGGSPTANKKRKTAAETLAAASASSSTANAVRLAAAAPTFLSPLIRPIDPAFLAAAASSLPALLPSGSTATANGKKPSVFPRIPVPGDQDNRMHLLAQGVGQLSQQQDQQQQQKQLDSEKEIQALRWLLQESQREKALLEAEVQRLRQQGAK